MIPVCPPPTQKKGGFRTLPYPAPLGLMCLVHRLPSWQKAQSLSLKCQE